MGVAIPARTNRRRREYPWEREIGRLGPAGAWRATVAELPRLITPRQLQDALGVRPGTVDAIFREVPVVLIPGWPRRWVRREHLVRALDLWTRLDRWTNSPAESAL